MTPPATPATQTATTRKAVKNNEPTPDPTWSLDPAEVLRESYRTVRKHGRPMTITALRASLVKQGVAIPGQDSTQDAILNSILRCADENFLRLQRRLGVCLPEMVTVEGSSDLRSILKAKGLSDNDIADVLKAPRGARA